MEKALVDFVAGGHQQGAPDKKWAPEKTKKVDARSRKAHGACVGPGTVVRYDGIAREKNPHPRGGMRGC